MMIKCNLGKLKPRKKQDDFTQSNTIILSISDFNTISHSVFDFFPQANY